jgi:hypothetical protein
MRLRILVLAAGLLWPVSSFSQGPGQEYFFKTGNVLLENCSAPPSSAPYIACFSYIAGGTAIRRIKKFGLRLCICSITLAFVSQAMSDRKTHRSDSADGASIIIE